MGDSNPRSGDWDNVVQGLLVFGGGAVLCLLLFILFSTGHSNIAFLVPVVVIIGGLIVAALKAGQHERDH